MRRLLASLLLFVFSFPLMAAVVFAPEPEAALPACCRRDGKHACGMRANSSAAVGLAWQKRQLPCAQFLAAPCTPVPAVDALAAVPPQPTGETLAAVAPVAAQPEIRYRISLLRTSQKRGPPSLV